MQFFFKHLRYIDSHDESNEMTSFVSTCCRLDIKTHTNTFLLFFNTILLEITDL